MSDYKFGGQHYDYCVCPVCHKVAGDHYGSCIMRHLQEPWRRSLWLLRLSALQEHGWRSFRFLCVSGLQEIWLSETNLQSIT
jgi:hypothetical protein